MANSQILYLFPQGEKSPKDTIIVLFLYYHLVYMFPTCLIHLNNIFLEAECISLVTIMVVSSILPCQKCDQSMGQDPEHQYLLYLQEILKAIPVSELGRYF